MMRGSGGWGSGGYKDYGGYDEEEEEWDEEEPEPVKVESVQEQMFDLDMLPSPWSGRQPVYSGFASCNTIQVMSTEDNRLAVVDGSDITEHKIPLSQGESIFKFFVDPRGYHILVSTTAGKNYYINPQTPPDKHSKTGAVRPCPQLRGFVVSSVGWDKRNSSNVNTGFVLLGTTQGQLVEARFNAKEKDCTIVARLLYDLVEKASDEPSRSTVTGLEVETFPTSVRKLLVMCTTPCRMYQFIGGPNFESLFAAYESTPPFNELPAVGNQLPCGKLVFWHDVACRAKTFAWITGVGIMHGRLVFRSRRHDDMYEDDDVVDIPEFSDQEAVVQDTHIIPYLDDDKKMPVSLAISEYHFYICYSDCIMIVGHPPGLNWSSGTEPRGKLKKSDLDARTDFKWNFMGRDGEVGLAIARDDATGQVYVVSNFGVNEVIVDDEKRNVWRQFLERALDPNERERETYFRKALKLCNAEDTAQREKVMQAKGDYHFEIGEYVEAARMYASTNQPFEETCLKFIDANQWSPLLRFLTYRLAFMKSRARSPTQEHSQFACLCTWVVEMYLDKLNNLQDEESAEERKEVSDEFKDFLQEHKDHLDKETTFDLISSHGQINEVLYFAELMEDYERVITHHIVSNINRDHTAAINVLTEHCLEETHAELWYQFSPVLIQHNPKQLVDGWMMKQPSEWMDCSKLIPALVKYDPAEHNPSGDKTNHAIRYLEWLINKQSNTDMAMHNMLLQFYSKNQDEALLLRFLQTSKNYDPKYALRLCLEANRALACIHIYSKMGLYEDAVYAALKIKNLELAKQNANKPDEDDIQLKKKLWQEIAVFISEKGGENGVKEAIELLKQTEYIKLEDVLPFFPAFVKVEDFKSEIRQSLEDYNTQISNIKFEMDEATKNSNTIRQQISSLRQRYGYITQTQKCVLCKKVAMTRPVLLFPSCNHTFHQDCLADAVKGNMEPEEYARLTDEEFEDQVSSQCLLCSEYMIAHIHKPFITDENEEATWSVHSGL